MTKDELISGSLTLSEDADTQETLINGINSLIANFDISDLDDSDISAMKSDFKGWIIDEFLGVLLTASDEERETVVQAESIKQNHLSYKLQNLSS